MKIRFLSLVFISGWLCAQSVHAQPTVYLVRHAEKLPAWLGDELDEFHPLSEAGVARAQKLAEQFQPGALAAIYSSRTTRTLHTVQPLAQKLGLEVQIAEACWDTSAIIAFFAELKQRHKPGEAVLLVSHSNIIPYLLIEAGLARKCWRELGIAEPSEDGWWLIEGYDSIWRVGKAGLINDGGCEHFSRLRF